MHCDVLFAALLQWNPTGRQLLFGTSGGEVLIHDSAGEFIVS